MRSEGGALCHGGERGSLAVELVVLTPVIVLFVLVALALGRLELAHEEVVGAARAAAEAAAVAPSAAEAEWAAVTAAQPVVANQVHSCVQFNVVTETGDFIPGGTVRVDVSCEIDFGDLLVPGLPGHTTVHAEVSAPIDPFRAVQ
jgi:Flp pilus assembly protein TadG